MIFFFILIGSIILYFIFKKKKKPKIEPVKENLPAEKKITIGYDDSETGFKHYMVFDTETDGLPLDRDGDPNDVENWPRIVQLSWMILDSDFKLVEIKDRYVKVDFEIDPSAVRIHGITKEKTDAEGILIGDIMEEFLTDLESSEILVAHNLEFDVPIIDAELLRLGKKRRVYRKRKICTMKYGYGLSRSYGDGRRFPSLPYLCELIYGGSKEDFTFHNARQDVILTGKVFQELIEIDYIKETWIRPKKTS